MPEPPPPLRWPLTQLVDAAAGLGSRKSEWSTSERLELLRQRWLCDARCIAASSVAVGGHTKAAAKTQLATLQTKLGTAVVNLGRRSKTAAERDAFIDVLTACPGITDEWLTRQRDACQSPSDVMPMQTERCEVGTDDDVVAAGHNTAEGATKRPREDVEADHGLATRVLQQVLPMLRASRTDSALNCAARLKLLTDQWREDLGLPVSKGARRSSNRTRVHALAPHAHREPRMPTRNVPHAHKNIQQETYTACPQEYTTRNIYRMPTRTYNNKHTSNHKTKNITNQQK